jgi:hypothetical protein
MAKCLVHGFELAKHFGYVIIVSAVSMPLLSPPTFLMSVHRHSEIQLFGCVPQKLLESCAYKVSRLTGSPDRDPTDHKLKLS